MLVQIRFDGSWAAFPLLAVVAVPAVALVYLGLQAQADGGAPPAFASTLLVSGLVLGIVALLRLADVLGADEATSAGTLTWVFALFGALALWPAVKRRSAIAGFLAAVSFGGAVLAGWQWLFDPDSVTPFRWLLLAIAVAYVMVSLVLRGSHLRHSELLVSAAGLAILGIALIEAVGLIVPFAPGGELPGFWELVVVVAGCGLIAYAAADKVPGPAYVGAAVLVSFVALAAGDDDTLLWWPLLLLGVGGAAMAAGLRPRRPLPPQPDAYGAGDLPLAARSRADETFIRTRDES